jgi:hypothetical protein
MTERYLFKRYDRKVLVYEVSQKDTCIRGMTERYLFKRYDRKVLV